jgi:uncharacterized protein (DUF58 family)
VSESEAPAHFDAELAQRIASLRLATSHVVDGIMSGLHRSPHRGASVVFVEHRDYRPGDDLRLLDWRAFARNDRHVTKRFEQETELSVTLWQDASASMAYGEGETEKARYAATLLATFATLAQSQGDAVGLARYDSALLDELPARTSAQHMRALEGKLAQAPSARSKTSIDAALGPSIERMKRRGVVLCASDLLDFDENALRPMETAARRGHDVRVFQILHRDERTLPFEGPHRFVGLEGESEIDANADDVRARYLVELEAHIESCRRRITSAGARHRLVITDEPLAEVITESLLTQGQRGGGGARGAQAGRARWA